MPTAALDPAIAQLITALARAKAAADYRAMAEGKASPHPDVPARARR